MAERAGGRTPTLKPDGSLNAVSPTQLVTFADPEIGCGLKWHFDKKAKLPKKPMGKGAALGDECHGRIERWATTGEDVRGPIELAGAHLLKLYEDRMPFRGGDIRIEGALTDPNLVTPGGILVTGFFDMYVPGIPGVSRPAIIDHKFKKDLEKYGVTPDDLADDPQAIIYGAWVVQREPEATGYVFAHHQHQTEGRRYAEAVPRLFTRDEVLAKFAKLGKLIDGPLSEAARIPAAPPGQTPDGVPFNTRACRAFGGCDFASVCKHSPASRFFSQVAESKNLVTSNPTLSPKEQIVGLLDQIEGAKAAATPPAANPTATAVQGILQVSQCKAGDMYDIGNGVIAKFEGLFGSRGIFKAGEGLAERPSESIVMQAAPTAPAAPAAAPPAPSKEIPLPPAAPPPALTAEKEAKRKKLEIVDVDTGGGGIAPPDAKPADAVAAPAPAPAAPAPAPATPATEPEKPKATRAKKEKSTTEIDSATDLVLVIDASTNKGTDLAPFVATLVETTAKTYGVPDVRLAGKESDLAFGGWRGVLSMAAKANPPKGFCFISSSELADPVIEALVPLASVVIRGRK